MTIALATLLPIAVAVFFYLLGVRNRRSMERERADILATLQYQVDALDSLFAQLAAADPTYFPSRSRQWDALVRGHQTICRLKGEPPA